MKTLVAMALGPLLSAAPMFAADADVPQESLGRMRLGGMQKISDAQGTKIRGTPKSYWPTRQWIYVIPLLF
jgi:hypothetical protein